MVKLIDIILKIVCTWNYITYRNLHFTITNVIGALTYQSGGNHDPDPSDSNGTLITVSRP